MLVVSVVPFSPGDESAVVTVTDGIHTCRAFCWPCDLQSGSEVVEPLQFFDESGLMFTWETEPRLESTSGEGFAHRGVAQVVDARAGLLAVGNLALQTDHLPAGISSGDMVEFECVRIDLR
ncbi:hypothetical protein KB221_08255 [Aquidulcibacter paucihalophilus]|nr:hypothetical protein KB221_08255 [Aquidulcibacter paucihalophilus]